MAPGNTNMGSGRQGSGPAPRNPGMQQIPPSGPMMRHQTPIGERMKMPGQMPNMGPNMMPMRMMGGPGPGPGMNMNSGASNNSMPQGWQGPGAPGMGGQMPPASQSGPANAKASMQKQSPNSPHPEGSGGPAGGGGNMPNMSRMQADGSPGMPQQGGDQNSGPPTGMAPNMPRGDKRGMLQFSDLK